MNLIAAIKPSRLCLSITALALAFLFSIAVPTAAAKGKGKKPAHPPTDTRILIGSVDASAGTIVIKFTSADKPVTTTYTLDGLTAITVNNAPGKIAQIESGMQVRDYVERDSHTLDSITVSVADPAPK